jgi:hypothetical protein
VTAPRTLALGSYHALVARLVSEARLRDGALGDLVRDIASNLAATASNGGVVTRSRSCTDISVSIARSARSARCGGHRQQFRASMTPASGLGPRRH